MILSPDRRAEIRALLEHDDVTRTTVGLVAQAAYLLACEEITSIVTGLEDVYSPQGVGVWLLTPHPRLQGARPIDVIRDGDIATVDPAVGPNLGAVA